MLQTGMRLNDTYVIISQIGSGGGGDVFCAYHERLQIEVVLKRIKSEVREILESRAEVDILKNLKHANLPQVYDFLEINGDIYTVMELIPGHSLDVELEQRGCIPEKEVLKWAKQLADALQYLHGQKLPIIHSDIKPGNIMLKPDGDICLIDFNIATVFRRGKQIPTGLSPGYSPPEQSRYFRQFINTSGDSVMTPSQMDGFIAGMADAGIDERSDVYSLGATLYHLLTGRKPLSSNSYEEIVPLDRCGVKISDAFSMIVTKMMALDPEDRYPSGKELFAVLSNIQELDAEYKDFHRTKRIIMIVSAVLLLAGGLMSVGGVFLMGRERQTEYNRLVASADSFIKIGEFEQAENQIEDAIALLGTRIDAYEKELYRLYSIGNYEETVSYGLDILNNPAYMVATKADQACLGNIYYLIGNAYFEQEDYMNAIPNFQSALSQNQENALYFRDYAITLAKTGYIDDAEQALEQAISLGLGQDSIYMTQGEIAHAKGENTQATEYLEEAIQTAEDTDLERRATILCAQVYQELGSAYRDREIALLTEAKGRFGSQISMHLTEMLGDAYVRKAQSDESRENEYYNLALDQFKALYDAGYSTRQMMENIAIVYEQLERFDEAEQLLHEIGEQYPDDYRSYKRLAFLEADRQQRKENQDRDYQKMRDYYQTAVSLYEKAGLEGDTEMQMLETMIHDLQDGGWF